MPKWFLSTLMFENHHCKHPIRDCSEHLPRAARASVSSKQWQSSMKFPASLLLLPTSPMSPNAKACPTNSLAYLCLPYRPVLSSLQTCLAYSCFPAAVVAKSPIFLMAFSFSAVRFQLECFLLGDVSLTTLFHTSLNLLSWFNLQTLKTFYLFVYFLYKNKDSLWQLPLFLFILFLLFIPMSPAAEPWLTNKWQSSQKQVSEEMFWQFFGWYYNNGHEQEAQGPKQHPAIPTIRVTATEDEKWYLSQTIRTGTLSSSHPVKSQLCFN